MIPAPEADLSALFAPEPTTRREAALRCAPERAARVLASIQRSLKLGGTTDFSQADIDPLADLPQTLQVPVADWGEHFALYGAVNAWLVFVGPSPGNYTAIGGLHGLLTSTPAHRNPTLGWPHPSFYYSNSDGFVVTIRAWARETLAGVSLFATEEEALSCTLLLNLTRGRFGNAKDVNVEEMATGAGRFLQSVVPVVRPRLVIALTRDVYSQLIRNRPPGTQLRGMPEVVFRDSSKKYELASSVIKHSGWAYPILLATVPNHPSRYRPLHGDYSSLYRYLRETARVARSLS